MAIHITEPAGTYLPGKDDNIYEFYGDRAADYLNYPDYFYQVQLKIDNVVKDVYKYVPNGTTPIRINIRNLIAPYFSYEFENGTTEMPYLPSNHSGVNKVLTVVLVINAFCVLPNGTMAGVGGDSGTSETRYYWNGTSNDFWDEKYNFDTILNYMATGTSFPADRPQWVGPKKPLSFISAYPSTPASIQGKLQLPAKNAAYDIHRGTYRTASAVLYDTDTHYFNDQYYVACYDCGGKMTKSGISIFDMRADFVPADKFVTVPVGVPQINDLAVTSLQTGKIFFQLTTYGASIGSERYIDDKDVYYQVMLMKSNAIFENQANSTIPLTFRIVDGKNDRRFMNYIDILYYSKLGAWWQIPAYRRNYKETTIKTDSYTLTNTIAKTPSSRNRKTVHVEATDEYVVNTGWLNSYQISEVEDMIQSPTIYLCIGGVNIPVSLTDSSYTIDTTDKRYLKAYTFKFQTDYNKQVIR